MVSYIIGCSYQISICTNGELLMSKYQELSKTFAESVQLQAKYISECCEFSNVFFSQLAALVPFDDRASRAILLDVTAV
jgi:hypothetical protein